MAEFAILSWSESQRDIVSGGFRRLNIAGSALATIPDSFFEGGNRPEFLDFVLGASTRTGQGLSYIELTLFRSGDLRWSSEFISSGYLRINMWAQTYRGETAGRITNSTDINISPVVQSYRPRVRFTYPNPNRVNIWTALTTLSATRRGTGSISLGIPDPDVNNLRLGTGTPDAVMLGTSTVDAMYLGTNEVYRG